MGKLVRFGEWGEGSYCHVIRGCDDDDDGDFQKKKAPRVVIMNIVNIGFIEFLSV